MQTYSYDSFGSITSTGSISQPYTYTAREYDAETGMYFYRARYYDPKVGRFVTKDPIGFKGGDVNWYLYVHSNPVNRTDPLGLYETLFGYTECFAEINWVALGIGVADYITGTGLQIEAPLFLIGIGIEAPLALPAAVPASVAFYYGGRYLKIEAKHSYSEAFEEYTKCVRKKKNICNKK